MAATSEKDELWDEGEVSADEEDETADNERKHGDMLDAIGALDGKKRSKPVRSEPLSEVSEYNLFGGEKVKLFELIGALKETSSHGEIKKQLSKVHKKQKVVPIPLSRPQKERLERGVAYEATTKEISKWDPVVEKNRKAEQLKFPLVQADLRVHRTTNQFAKQFKPRTPLEIEVAALLHGSQNVLKQDQVLTPAEEKALKAMSLQEAKERRAELQKYRALLSYKEAKARRQNKIKSKRFHRIQRKQKQKQDKKAMEELQQKDPEAYGERLMNMDKDRIQERMSLKHRGGSKFMQRQIIFGKYDDDGRQAVQDMIQKNKELTNKMVIESDSDGVSDPDDGANIEDDKADSKGKGTSTNPWMIQSKIKKPRLYQKPKQIINTKAVAHNQQVINANEVQEELTTPGPDDLIVNRESHGGEVATKKDSSFDQAIDKSESESVGSSDEDDNVTNQNIDEIFSVFDKKQADKRKEETVTPQGEDVKELNQHERKRQRKKQMIKMKKVNREKKKIEESESESDMSDSDLDDRDTLRHQNTAYLEPSENSQMEGLSGSLTRKRTLEDYDGDWVNEAGAELMPKLSSSSGQTVGNKDDIEEVVVDPSKFMTVETSLRQPHLPSVVDDEEGELDAEEQQRMTIAQAFASDDVVEEFSRDKKSVEDREKVKDINLTLPGWGDWGGTGVKPSRKKRRRFLIKAPPAPPRKDTGLGNVIISETKDNTVSKHQVSNLPFPFTSVHQFESSMRHPIGKTWNPETAVKQLVRPKVVTRLGTVIDPINKSETFKKQKVHQKKGSGRKKGKTQKS